MSSATGFGDMGYNDLILEGVMTFCINHGDVALSLLRPATEAQARHMIRQWIASTSTEREARSILLLGSDEYENLLSDMDVDLNQRQAILLFESMADNLPEGVSTFAVSRYGLGNLCGLVGGESPRATVIAANPDNPMLKDAVTGFCDGYRSIAPKDPEVICLSTAGAGYNMPEKCYEIASLHTDSYIYPLAGGSNSGLYKYSREEPFVAQTVVGMDRDCSLLSSRIPFSQVIHMDKILEELLEDWHSGRELPESKTYSLSDSGYVELAINRDFFKNSMVFLEWYDRENYWSEKISQYFDEAIKNEQQYYGR